MSPRKVPSRTSRCGAMPTCIPSPRAVAAAATMLASDGVSCGSGAMAVESRAAWNQRTGKVA